MTKEGKTAVVAQELACAHEELQAAEQLLVSGIPRVALTRVYFAVFHAVRALLANTGIEPKSHRALVNLFGLHFVRTGRYEGKYGKFLASLQRFREDADYGLATWADDETARSELNQARKLVARIVAELG